MSNTQKLRYFCFLTVSLIFLLFSCSTYIPPIPPVPPSSHIKNLSFYLPSLKDTPGDTVVHILDSGKPGARLLLVAGTHGNEIAGIYAADTFAAQAGIESGIAFIIPRLNNPGIIAGTRLVPVEVQGLPDPSNFIPPEGDQEMAGFEQRNINRSYPGSEEMGLTQKIALAVMNLLIDEGIHIAIDMHEADPTRKNSLAWSIISLPQYSQYIDSSIEDLNAEGISMRRLTSSGTQGISHWEWGRRSQAMAFLIETGNPQMASNPTQEELDDPHHHLDYREIVHLETIRYLVYHSNLALSPAIVPFVYTLIME